ncbi:MAG: DUF3871 family protein, partial [Clostridiales bacterium]|nr:DUF3871 family protein [Clostridiales bacterium]
DAPSDSPASIASNSQAITLAELENENIVPTFSDLNPVIAHQTFANTVKSAAMSIFPNEKFGDIEMRVSHQTNGRIPSALHVPVNELQEWQKTKYYQRFAFAFEILSMSETINGKQCYLTIGGTRSLSNTNLFGKQAPQKFSIFIGWRASVCSNGMIHTDGLKSGISCLTSADIFENSFNLFSNYDAMTDLRNLRNLGTTSMTTEQFCGILGRFRLYSAMSDKQRKQLSLPEITLGDSLLNAATKNFVTDSDFGINGREAITCFDFLNLLNAAAKNSYIDLYAARNADCTTIAVEIQKAINHEDTPYSWFLN